MSYNNKRHGKENVKKDRGGLFGKLFSGKNDNDDASVEHEMSLNEMIDAENDDIQSYLLTQEMSPVEENDADVNEEYAEDDISDDDFSALLAAAVTSVKEDDEEKTDGADVPASPAPSSGESDIEAAKDAELVRSESVSGAENTNRSDDRTNAGASGESEKEKRKSESSEMLKKIKAIKARAGSEVNASAKGGAEQVDVGANTDVFEEYEYVVNDGKADAADAHGAVSEILHADEDADADADGEPVISPLRAVFASDTVEPEAADAAEAESDKTTATTEKASDEDVTENISEDAETVEAGVENVEVDDKNAAIPDSDGEARDESVAVSDVSDDTKDADAVADAKTEDSSSEDAADAETTESVDKTAPAEDDDSELLFALGYSDEADASNAQKYKTRARRGVDLRSDYNGAFGYRGEEYTSREQTEEINRAYRVDGLSLAMRVVGSAILTLAIIIFELFGKKFGGVVSVVDYPAVHILVSMQLLLLLAAMSWRQLTAGLIGIFHFEITPHSAASAAVLVVLIYDALLAAVTPDEFTLYNLPAALCVAMSVIYDVLDYARQVSAFKSLSSWESCCVLENTDPVALAAALGSSSSRGRDDAGINHAMRLRRGNFAKGYFKRTNSKDPALRMLNYVIAPVIALSLVIFFISVAAGRGLVPSANTFTVMVLVALPVFAMIGLIYPFFDMARNLLKSDEVLLSAADADKFSDIDAIIFDEEDVFGPRSLMIKRIGLCDGIMAQDVFGILDGAYAVFDKAGGALASAFRRATENNVSAELEDKNDAEIIRISDGGITARACGRDYLIGNDNFMAINGVAVNSSVDDRDSGDAGSAVMYIAVDHELALKLCVSYIIDEDFRRLAAGLSDSGICPVMISSDPNLDDALLARLLGGSERSVRVIRDKLNGEQDAKTPEDKDSEVDSGLVANGEDWTALVDAVSQCGKLRRVSLLNTRISLAIMAVSVLASAFLGALGIFTGMNSIYVAIYQIICVLPAMITSKLMQN